MARPYPRYTSYPTAPHFSPRVSELHAVSWLAALEGGVGLSLYIHIPFCHSLCWYCGCSTKATRRYPPVAHYLHFLVTEIANVAALVPPQHEVTHIHWGGGSPNILLPADIRMLAHEIGTRFKVSHAVDFAVEIDPRHIDGARVDAFVEAGCDVCQSACRISTLPCRPPSAASRASRRPKRQSMPSGARAFAPSIST